MKPDTDVDIFIEDVPAPRQLIQKITQLHKGLRRVVIKVLLENAKNPKKVNGVSFESTPPPESPEEIAEVLIQMAISDHDSHKKPPRHYEAWCEITSATGQTSTKYVRFKVDPLGSDVSSATDESEMETLVRAAITLAESMGAQNKELHETLLKHSNVLQATVLPYKEVLHEMAAVASNSYKQLTYALYLIMDTRRQDKEIELKETQWREGMGVIKEFVPEALKQKVTRLIDSVAGTESSDGDDDEDEDKSAEKETSSEETAKHEVKLSSACRAFGASITSAQWPELRKVLKPKDLELLEKACNVEEGAEAEAAKLVNRLRKALSSTEMKLALRRIFSLDQAGVMGAILGKAKGSGAKSAKTEEKPSASPAQ
jgi:hypothetical protein